MTYDQYQSTKKAVEGLVELVKDDLRHFGIRVELKWKSETYFGDQVAVIECLLPIKEWQPKFIGVAVNYSIRARDLWVERDLDSYIKYLRRAIGDTVLGKLHTRIMTGPDLPQAPEQDWRPDSILPEDYYAR